MRSHANIVFFTLFERRLLCHCQVQDGHVMARIDVDAAEST